MTIEVTLGSLGDPMTRTGATTDVGLGIAGTRATSSGSQRAPVAAGAIPVVDLAMAKAGASHPRGTQTTGGRTVATNIRTGVHTLRKGKGPRKATQTTGPLQRGEHRQSCTPRLKGCKYPSIILSRTLTR